jgi:hypothetical protein
MKLERPPQSSPRFAALIAMACFTMAVAREPAPYEPNPNAAEALADATTSARENNRRVWVQISQAGCPACERLHWFLSAHPSTSELLDRHYEVVQVALSRQNIPLLRAWNSPQLTHGTPVILVIDPAGKLITTLTVAELKNGGTEFTEEALEAHLKKWAPKG